MGETYANKATRPFTLESIAFKKKFYLHPDILESELNKVKDYPYCYQTVKSQWSFLGGNNKIKFKFEEFLPKDLFYDNSKEDRIGIVLLSSQGIELNELIHEYCVKNGVKEGIDFFDKKPKKNQISSKKINFLRVFSLLFLIIYSFL